MDDAYRVPSIGELVRMRIDTCRGPYTRVMETIRIVSGPRYNRDVYLSWRDRFPRLGRAAGYLFLARILQRGDINTIAMIEIVRAREEGIRQPGRARRFPLTSIG